MSGILNIVGILASFGSLVCFIMVVMKMFQNGKKGAGIASILTSAVSSATSSRWSSAGRTPTAGTSVSS